MYKLVFTSGRAEFVVNQTPWGHAFLNSSLFASSQFRLPHGSRLSSFSFLYKAYLSFAYQKTSEYSTSWKRPPKLNIIGESYPDKLFLVYQQSWSPEVSRMY